MEVHRSARKHGVSDADVLHACDNAIVVADLGPHTDPPKVLFIGADQAGHLLEVIALALADERMMAIHAMPLRAGFHALLPMPEDPNG